MKFDFLTLMSRTSFRLRDHFGVGKVDFNDEQFSKLQGVFFPLLR